MHELACGAVAFIVVPVATPDENRAVCINLTLRESALRRIDEAAREHRMSRSSYLVQRRCGRQN